MTLDIVNRIPDRHPHKRAVEDVLRRWLESLPGTWIATLQNQPAWWLLEVCGPDTRFSMMFRPADQNPRTVEHQLVSALARRGLATPLPESA